MAYQIDRYNNTLLTVVEDGTIDRTTDLKFIGKNFAGYGEIQNENFLYLLENFSGANPPPRAVSGQIWFDSSQSKLKLYDGVQWKTIGGAEANSTEPVGLASGDFWWDTLNEQLYAYNGNSFVLIGPQRAGDGITQMRSITVKDVSGNDRYIIAATINTADVVYIISANEFTLNSSTPITGFDRIRQGITLVNTTLTDSGVTTGSYRFWGTASNSEKLNGFTSDDFLRSQSPNFDQQVTIVDEGLVIGNGLDFRMYIENGDQAVIENVTGASSEIIFKATNTLGNPTSVFTVTHNALTPLTDSQMNLGSLSRAFLNVYSDNFVGEATKATTVKVGAGYLSASTSDLPDTIAARDSSGNLYATNFVGNISGTSTTADKLTNSRTISLIGDVTGSVSFDGSANVTLDTTLAERTLTLTGDVTGSATLDSSTNITITASIQNDSHSHSNYITSDANDTVSANTTWLDNQQVNLGTSSDTRLYHNGSHTYMDHYTGNIYIRDNSTTRFTFERTTGNFTASGDVAAFSDVALKTNIRTIDSALDKVLNMRGVYFDKDGKSSTGVIAQEIEKVLPEVVNDGDMYKSVAYGNIVGILIEAIKELNEEIKTLKEQG